jgi:exodeoxyribonuclease VII small subunit
MSADKDLNADVAKMSYEQARDELIKVVAELEQGAVSLEASLTLWERGEALANQCETWLSGARKRLDDAIEAKKSKA